MPNLTNELDTIKIGNLMALLRKEKGLTGEKFAELLGVSAQAVSKWENGKCLPEAALLPVISKILGTTIDSLLIPRQLFVLKAVYSDGTKEMDVTQTINNYVNGNSIQITVNSQFLGIMPDSPRIGVLTLKYQTPDGIFYDYAVWGSELLIDLSTVKYSSETGFEIIGAYYGNSNSFQSAIQKIRHYEYFQWDEIPVNHESFPSSPSTDELEFLTLVYRNKKGIHVVSCAENETLCYSSDRTELFLKDTSSRLLPGIRTLEWETGIDCTWAGAMFAALEYLGEPYTYEQIMGMSGTCYRIAFTEIWDWSVADALVAYDYSSPLFSAIGYEQVWADRVEKEDRCAERNRIVKAIAGGKPVVAINLRIAPEWGVITGYKDNGKVFLCRTYFDKECLNENKEYLETDFWPFLIMHFGEKTGKLSEIQILTASLQTLVNSFEAPCERGYYQGLQAYEKWIDGLKDDVLWDDRSLIEDIKRRLCVNDYMLLNLIDARRCAGIYLNDCRSLLTGIQAELLQEISGLYSKITEMLQSFRNKIKASNGEDLFYNVIQTKGIDKDSFRKEQIGLLVKTLEIEQTIVSKAKAILS